MFYILHLPVAVIHTSTCFGIVRSHSRTKSMGTYFRRIIYAIADRANSHNYEYRRNHRGTMIVAAGRSMRCEMWVEQNGDARMAWNFQHFV